jgi:hypothetical protein
MKEGVKEVWTLILEVAPSLVRGIFEVEAAIDLREVRTASFEWSSRA